MKNHKDGEWVQVTYSKVRTFIQYEHMICSTIVNDIVEMHICQEKRGTKWYLLL